MCHALLVIFIFGAAAALAGRVNLCGKGPAPGEPRAAMEKNAVTNHRVLLDAANGVVTNSMLAIGGHNYQTLTEGVNWLEGDSQYMVMKEWFRRQQRPIQTPTDQRIVRQAMIAGNSGQ